MSLNVFRNVLRNRALRRAYVVTFATPEGRMVLHDILARGGVLQTSFVEGDAHASAFNEGKRRLSLEILEQLSWTENQMVKLAERVAGDRLRATEDATETEMD